MRNFAKEVKYPNLGSTPEGRAIREKKIPEIQLQLRSNSRLMQFRELGVSFFPPLPVFTYIANVNFFHA